MGPKTKKYGPKIKEIRFCIQFLLPMSSLGLLLLAFQIVKHSFIGCCD